MTFDRRVADAVELIEFLRRHLDTDKVVVLAESMGTLTGLPLALRRPDLLHALVVTDLYVNMAANEARKWQLTLERLRAAGNKKGVAALEAIGDPARWELGPGTPTWRGRSGPMCPRRIWTAGCCSPWRCRRRSTACGTSPPYSRGSSGPPPRCSASSWPTTPGGWVPASRSRSSCSRARPT